MRADERHVWVRSDHPFERIDQSLEPRETRIGERPLGMGEQLLETLVVLIDGGEERHGVRDVDHDRQPELASGAPHDREPLVVWEQQLVAFVADREPEVLPDLDSPRTRGRGCTEVLRQPAGPAALREHRSIEMAERREAARVRTVVPLDVPLKLGAPPPVEVHDRVHVARRHVGEQRVDVADSPATVGCQPTAEMVVRVHRGEPSARYLMMRQPDGRAWTVRAQREIAQRGVQRSGLQAGRPHGVIPW